MTSEKPLHKKLWKLDDARNDNNKQHVAVQVIVKERHETIMGYKPRERVALEWFIPIIVELLVL